MSEICGCILWLVPLISSLTGCWLYYTDWYRVVSIFSPNSWQQREFSYFQECWTIPLLHQVHYACSLGVVTNCHCSSSKQDWVEQSGFTKKLIIIYDNKMQHHILLIHNGVSLWGWISTSCYSLYTGKGLKLMCKCCRIFLALTFLTSRNPGDHFSFVDGMGVAIYPHCGVGPSENGTNHSHLYFQSVMSFPCVLTNPLHQHLSHGEEGVQRNRASNRPINIVFFFFFVVRRIYILVLYAWGCIHFPHKHAIFYEWEWLRGGVNMEWVEVQRRDFFCFCFIFIILMLWNHC